MKEHPILFSGPMVRAILTCAKCGKISVPFPCEHCGSTDFVKTQTRRVIRGVPDTWSMPPARFDGKFFNRFGCQRDKDSIPCPYGVPGDRLWVRETFACRSDIDGKTEPTRARHYIVYRADANGWRPDDPMNWHDFGGRWRPSIHMPRWASRILLEVKSVRVERVQDIGLHACIAEGIDEKQPDGHALSIYQLRGRFRALWDTINAKRGYPWDSNPWDWAITFERIT